MITTSGVIIAMNRMDADRDLLTRAGQELERLEQRMRRTQKNKDKGRER